MEFIKIGIMPQEKIRERILSIAPGEIKPVPGDPKIWFTSIRSLVEVITDHNLAVPLLRDTNDIKS